MRHMSPKLGAVQVATARRHSELRNEINEAIQCGTHYPWALLAKLDAQKFYSDIVESLIGAVWIDSGSFDACEEIVERMGILPYLRRILSTKVQVWHPKEQLGILAGNEKVKYTIDRHKITELEEADGRGYWCKITIGGAEIVEVGGGVNKEEIMTKAAEAAVMRLKEKRTEPADGTENGILDIMDIEQ